MILTITLNPCIDKSSRVPHFEPEAKLRCTEIVNEAGGGGINVSKALKRLDVSSVALFPSGGHNGRMLNELLTEEGIDFRSVDTKVETRENWIVLETEKNNQFRFTFPGRSVEEAVIKKLIEEIRAFSPRLVIASGSLPPGLPDYFYGLIIKTAKSVGARCIVDTSGSALQAVKNKGAFLIKPNRSELSKMLNAGELNKEDISEAARQAIVDGYAEIIVVSMGGEGGWLVTEEEKIFVAAPKVEKKSTVGAGDSMVAGMSFALQKELPLKEVLQWGVACGSAATMNEGTQLFDQKIAQQLFAKIREA